MQTSTKIPEQTRTRPRAPVKEHVRADRKTVTGPPRRRLRDWGVAAVVFAALVGLASALLVINPATDTAEVVEEIAVGPVVGSQEFLYNLAEQGYSLDKLPYVIQYNKRDLPNILSVEQLRSELNPTGVPDFEAVAVDGVGVFETLKSVSKLVVKTLS